MKRKIQKQFMLYFLLLTVCPLLVLAAYSYYNVKVNAEQKLYDSIQDNLAQNQNTFSEKYSRFAKYMDIVTNSSEFYDVLHQVSQDLLANKYDVAQFNAIAGLDRLLKSMLATDTDVAQTLIIVNGRCVYAYSSYFPVNKLLTEDSLMQRLSGTTKLNWIGNVENPFGVYSGLYTIVAKDIKNVTRGSPNESICQFIIMIQQSRMTSVLEKSSEYPGDIVALLDDSNEILAVSSDSENNRERLAEAIAIIPSKASRDKQALTFYNMGGTVVTYTRDELSDWKIMKLTPKAYFTEASTRIVLFTVSMIIGLLAALLLFSWLLSIKVFAPIRLIADAMKKVGKKDFSIALSTHAENEIGDIFNGFNDMVANVDTLFRRTLEQESQKRIIEINMLKYQINPHFLYNTLNSIRYAALKQEDRPTAEMLLVLSRLLRNTISRVGDEIHLEQELDNVRDYLFLQQVRYDGGIAEKLEIDSSTMDLFVPGMILQPIIENSIMHGLNERLNSGLYAEIKIASEITEDSVLILSVTDNGSGIPEDKQDTLLNDRSGEGMGDAHIGLNNIHKRIQLQYGGAYGISLESDVGVFTRVKVCLPLLRREEDGLC